MVKDKESDVHTPFFSKMWMLTVGKGIGKKVWFSVTEIALKGDGGTEEADAKHCM